MLLTGCIHISNVLVWK